MERSHKKKAEKTVTPHGDHSFKKATSFASTLFHLFNTVEDVLKTDW